MTDTQMSVIRVVSFALLALASLLYVYQYSRSIDRNFPARTFTVDGTGEIETVPDVATFSVSVVSETSRTVTEVQTANAEKMNAITAYLKKEGVEAKDLKTTQYNLNPRYNYVPCTATSCPAPTINGYTLTQSLQVKVRDTEKLGGLLSGVVANGGNNVSEVRFVVDDDTDAKSSAREEAIDKAKEKANEIAKATGFRLGRIVSLYESSDAPTPYGMGMGGATDSAVAKSVAPNIEPGVQASKVQVNITYEILP